jgi:hypothetical protein
MKSKPLHLIGKERIKLKLCSCFETESPYEVPGCPSVSFFSFPSAGIIGVYHHAWLFELVLLTNLPLILILDTSSRPLTPAKKVVINPQNSLIFIFLLPHLPCEL